MNQPLASIEKLLRASKELEISTTKKEIRTLVVEEVV